MPLCIAHLLGIMPLMYNRMPQILFVPEYTFIAYLRIAYLRICFKEISYSQATFTRTLVNGIGVKP